MWSVLSVEAGKLNRSLALLLCAAAPTFVAVLSLLMLLEREDSAPWGMFLMGGSALWAYFMLPMTVTALTVLVAQIEHGPRAWNYVLALPVPRWRVFLAKAAVVVGLVAAMSAALYGLLCGAAALASAVKPGSVTGAPEWWSAARTLALMFAGSLLLIAVQLWTALRFRSFVPPLVLGIGGTFVSVAATSAKQGAFFPWLIPVNALAADPERSAMAISIGFFGGLAVLAAMLVHMSRYEAP
jgi:ABC-2 type transport system permease protein